ncbi:hypothetical protein [Streptomyces decoyicus]|nr:hypothetical protein OG532_08340 [Streptomyces decoyicus]
MADDGGLTAGGSVGKGDGERAAATPLRRAEDCPPPVARRP